MANQNENQTLDEPTTETGPPENKGSEKGPTGLDALIARLPLPPKYRTRKWVLGGAAALALLLLMWVQCNSVNSSGPDEPVVAPVAVAMPTPEPTPIPRDEYQLPRQYAFVHFVNEMAACYEQNGQVATLETVEADIMADVPNAVGALMGLYSANQCEAAAPWHQIPGRIGWMIRASGINEHLPALEEPQ